MFGWKSRLKTFVPISNAGGSQALRGVQVLIPVYCQFDSEAVTKTRNAASDIPQPREA